MLWLPSTNEYLSGKPIFVQADRAAWGLALWISLVSERDHTHGKGRDQSTRDFTDSRHLRKHARNWDVLCRINTAKNFFVPMAFSPCEPLARFTKLFDPGGIRGRVPIQAGGVVHYFDY
jgi:hypothetical protein